MCKAFFFFNVFQTNPKCIVQTAVILGQDKQEESRASGLQTSSNMGRKCKSIYFISNWGTGVRQIWEKRSSITTTKKKKGVSVLRRPQEAQTGYDQNLCIDILSLKVRQQKLRSIFQHTEQKEKCIIEKNVKGHFIIWCYFVVLTA